MSINQSGANSGIKSTNVSPQLLSTGLAHPFTFGGWFNTNSAATLSYIASLADSTSGTIRYMLGIGSSGIPTISAGLATTASTTTALTTGTWNFLLGRFIGAANRRVSVLHYNGLVEHAQSTTSVTLATTIDNAGIGYVNSNTTAGTCSGLLAEIWFAAGDPAVTDQNTPTPLLMQLAFGGPFSLFPGNVLEYVSFRSWLPPGITPSGPIGSPVNEWYSRNGTSKIPGWTQAGSGFTLDAHPALPYWYVRPGEGAQYMTI